MVLDLKPLDLLALVKQALDANRAYGTQSGVTFLLVQSVPDALVYADADRLMQVLANLLRLAGWRPAEVAVEHLALPLVSRTLSLCNV